MVLWPALRNLHVDGKPVRLGSRAFDLLVVLTERAGRLTEKVELMRRAWPGLTVDAIALRVQISAIRKALGPGSALAIEAVPGRGYRLHLKGVAGDHEAPADSALAGADRAIFGRDRHIARLVDDLDRHRLVTIVGPGGIGKTTVAVEVCRTKAQAYPDGFCIVDLAAVTDGARVGSTIARHLRLAVFTDDPMPGIVAHLQHRRMLLLIDTCEHVIDAVAAIVGRIIDTAPGVTILATSREPLRVGGERVQRLPPLDLPALGPEARMTLAEMQGYSALALFIDRMRAAGGAVGDADDRPIVAMCRRLDGLPMAIEIAAAQAALQGIAAAAEQIGARLAAPLHQPRAGRHRTIRSMLEWSYGLLSGPEQRALCELAIFPGHFTFAGAAAVLDTGQAEPVAALALVGNLVSKSLVSAPTSDAATYRLLDTTREYAREKLGPDGEGSAREYRDVALRHARFLLGDLSRSASNDRDDLLLEDVRAALDWCFGVHGDRRIGVELATVSIDFWTRLALFVEHRSIVERALHALDALGLSGTIIELKLRLALGKLLYHSGGMALDRATDATFRRALLLATAHRSQPDEVKALSGLVAQGISRGDYPGVMMLKDKLEAVGGTLGQVTSRAVAHTLIYLGDLPATREVLSRDLPDPVDVSTTGSGVNYDHVTVVETIRARLLWLTDDVEGAIAAAETAIANATVPGPPISLCLTLATSALFVTTMTGQARAAEHYLAMLEEHAARHSMQRWSEYVEAYRLALVPRHQRTDRQARRFDAIVADSNGALLESLAVLGNDRTTRTLVAQALSGHAGWCRPELVRAQIEHDVRSGALSPAQAAPRLLQALQQAREKGMKPWELRIATSYMELARTLGRADDGRNVLGPVIASMVARPRCPALRAAHEAFDAG